MPASPAPAGIGHGSRRRLAQHLDSKSPLLDPAVSLAFVAAHTQRVKLGTGIIILPQGNPLVFGRNLSLPSRIAIRGFSRAFVLRGTQKGTKT